MRDYADIDGVDDKNDRETDLNWTIARLRVSDVATFASSFDSPSLKLRAVEGALFKGVVYRADLRDLMLRRRERLHDVRETELHAMEWRDGYTGNSGTLAGLAFDPATGQVRFPAQVSPQDAQGLRMRLVSLGASVGVQETAYRERWLLPIVRRYSAQRATIIIYRIPQRPIAIEPPFRPRANSFLNVARTYRGVVVLNEHMFDDLQRPDYFFDGLHMNARGRAEFSKRLGMATRDVLANGDAL